MRNVKICLKSAFITLLCIVFFAFFYLSFCRVYETMQSRLHSDERGAVVIGENYFKFFDKEFYF